MSQEGEGEGQGELAAFGTPEDVLSWAKRLTREEMLVELEFLGVPRARTKGADRSSLSRMLADAMVVRGTLTGGGGRGSSRRRRGPGAGDGLDVEEARRKLADVWRQGVAAVQGEGEGGRWRAGRRPGVDPLQLDDWEDVLIDGIGSMASQAKGVLRVARKAAEGVMDAAIEGPPAPTKKPLARARRVSTHTSSHAAHGGWW
jgi:hypothetical protein